MRFWDRFRKYRAEEYWACNCGLGTGRVVLQHPMREVCKKCGKPRPDDDVTKAMLARIGKGKSTSL